MDEEDTWLVLSLLKYICFFQLRQLSLVSIQVLLVYFHSKAMLYEEDQNKVYCKLIKVFGYFSIDSCFSSILEFNLYNHKAVVKK